MERYFTVVEYYWGRARKILYENQRDEVARIRKSVGLALQQFSDEFKIVLRTLRKREQGKRVPHGPAHVLLKVIEVSPNAVMKALKHA